jgi:hypothetical protein
MLALALLASMAPGLRAQDRWTEDQANAWYARQAWPVGANFLPSKHINELNTWQGEPFDAALHHREMGGQERLG